jgi:hypothetical protein
VLRHDEAAPQTAESHSGVSFSVNGSEEWAQGVLANAVTTTATVTVTQPGVQTFCLHMVDPGVVVEAFVIEPAPLPGRRDR